MDRHFGGAIWTNHALQRLKERQISQSDAYGTWRNPEQSRPGNNKKSWIYYRTYGANRIEVVATQNEKKEWVIMSVWARPVDRREKYVPRSSVWDKFLENTLRFLFGWAKSKRYKKQL